MAVPTTENRNEAKQSAGVQLPKESRSAQAKTRQILKAALEAGERIDAVAVVLLHKQMPHTGAFARLQNCGEVHAAVVGTDISVKAALHQRADNTV